MNTRRSFFWVSVIVLINIAFLACFFRDNIISLSSTSISISDHVSSNGDHQAIIGELEKMWQEKLIEDLFRDTTAVAPNILHKDMKHAEGYLQTGSGIEATKSHKHAVVVEEKLKDDFKQGTSHQSEDENLKESEFNVQQRLPPSKLDDDVGLIDNDAKLMTDSGKDVQYLDNQLEKDSEHQEHVTSLPKQPKMVLLLTQSRHGSTWLMDMLGYRDDAVPVFEPLNVSKLLKMYALSDEMRKETLAEGYDPVKYEDWREILLARICLCDWHGKKIGEKKVGNILGLWYKEKRAHPEHKGRYDTKAAEAMCSEEGSMMVPKTIRYYNMSTLFRIQDFGCEHFKVIHLVRDPRAVMNSRMGVFHELYDGSKTLALGAHIESKNGQEGFDEDYMARAADWMCSHHLYNYELGMNPPPWLEGRYKMVRYEDLAEFPSQLTSEILHFIGVNYTSKYKEYVYNLTHVKERGAKPGSSYGVEKQTSEIIDKWKSKLIERHWRTIERVCADMMKAFNYEPNFFIP